MDTTVSPLDDEDEAPAPAPRLGLLDRARGYVQRARFDLTQAAGAVATLAGVYTLIGLGATLIIGGVSIIAVSLLREGGRI